MAGAAQGYALIGVERVTATASEKRFVNVGRWPVLAPLADRDSGQEVRYERDADGSVKPCGFGAAGLQRSARLQRSTARDRGPFHFARTFVTRSSDALPCATALRGNGPIIAS
jgi:hypothetical protein